MNTIDVEVPEKFEPLLYPQRYKGAYGGRGAAKSHFFAEQLILRCFQRKTRWACLREVQNTLRDSVHQLLGDKIQKLGLGWYFKIMENEIRAPNGSMIIFRGMQSYNAENIKSLEGFDGAWVEEAQTLSDHSLTMLRPTLRKEGSELWFSWNPRFKTDPVDKFFRKRPPPDAVSVMVNWRDNPWFPDVLQREMDHDFEVDEDKAEHVWNGAYGAMQGAILAKWMNKARRQGRIVPTAVFDPHGASIEISSDIGYRDTATWWFWQRKLGGFTVFKVIGDSGLDADEWSDEIMEILLKEGIAKIVQRKGQPEEIDLSMLGKIWLPHDAKVKTFQSKHSSLERFIKKFGFRKMGIVPQSKKADQISAARHIVDKCEFNSIECEDGIDALDAWEFEYIEEKQDFSKEPLHNWASHYGDGFAYGCQVMQGLTPPEEKPEERKLQIGPGSTVTLDDLYANQPERSTRI